MDFYPRSPCGERPYLSILFLAIFEFLSTLSLRRATHYDNYNLHCVEISIHALLAESDDKRCKFSRDNGISIHALLAESDCRRWNHSQKRQQFLSTLSLRRATRRTYQQGEERAFLSTLSLRRATLAGPSGPAFLYNFYPRSPCGERLRVMDGSKSSIEISIHALLAESDARRESRQQPAGISIHALLAESDRSARPHTRRRDAISIHALLAESDKINPANQTNLPDFYPRSPCGERLSITLLITLLTQYFYPRSPCGERHDYEQYCTHARGISIHALLAESDETQVPNPTRQNQFLSTLSLRRATRLEVYKRHYLEISIHALLAESDKPSLIVSANPPYFYPRSPCGERHKR